MLDPSGHPCPVRAGRRCLDFRLDEPLLSSCLLPVGLLPSVPTPKPHPHPRATGHGQVRPEPGLAGSCRPLPPRSLTHPHCTGSRAAPALPAGAAGLGVPVTLLALPHGPLLQ